MMEKAIEDIVRMYLRQETDLGHMVVTHANPPNPGPGKHGANPERPFVEGDAQAPTRALDQGQGRGHDNDVDSEQVQLEQEFMHALYQCLEEKGVLKEVQAFIRQRLVLILRGAWPTLVQTKCDHDSHTSLALIQDFLCVHKLLFTFSVFTTELVADDFKFRDDFGKMRSQDVEQLLSQLGHSKGTPQNADILKLYFSKQNWSLLECMVHNGVVWNPKHVRSKPKPKKQRQESVSSSERHSELSLDEKLRRIDRNFDKILVQTENAGDAGKVESNTDKRVRTMRKDLEKDAEIRIQDRIQRFKQEEVGRIRDEIETKLKFQFLQKEKELLVNYEEKVAQMRRKVKHEREEWFLEKFRHEQEWQKRRRKELGKPLSGTDQAGAGDSVHIGASAAADSEPNLENFHQSLLEKYNDLIASTGLSDDMSDFGLKREIERSYLLKEAAMRNTIDKLKSENEHLKSEKSASAVQSPNKKEHETPAKRKDSNSNANHGHRNREPPMDPMDEDARAFLQYTVECQAEQITNMQHQIHELTVKTLNASVKVDKPQLRRQTNEDMSDSNSDVNLDQFLQASKQRFTEIEQQTQYVRARMRQLQAFNKSLPDVKQGHEERQAVAPTPVPRPSRLPEALLRDSISARFPPVPNILGVASSIGLHERKVHFTATKIDYDPPYRPQVQVQGPQTPRGPEPNTNPYEIRQYEPLEPKIESSSQRPGTNAILTQTQNRETENNSLPAASVKSPDTEKRPPLTLDRDTRTEVHEPIAIAQRAYLTGALIRDKVPSSASDDEPDHSKAGHKMPEPKPTPTQKPARSFALSLVDEFTDIEMETGKASDASASDEDDGLW